MWANPSEWRSQVVGNKAYVEAHSEGETFKTGTYKNK